MPGCLKCLSLLVMLLPHRAALRVKAVATTAKKETSSTSAPSKAAITPEHAKDLYYDMVLGRDFEEMCAQMYYRGKMFGFVHLYSGQEAVSTGVYPNTTFSCSSCYWTRHDLVCMHWYWPLINSHGLYAEGGAQQLAPSTRSHNLQLIQHAVL